MAIRYLVHTNSAFRSAEDIFLLDWVNLIRPSYNVPSRYVLSHTIMDAEAARAQVEEIARLKSRKKLTLLFDGWEDKLRRSLYGTVAAQLGTPPTVLSLDELTGHRGSAVKYLETLKGALKKMDMSEARNIIALCTDDPTVMRALRRLFGADYYWVLVRFSIYEQSTLLTLKADFAVLFAQSQYNYRENSRIPHSQDSHLANGASCLILQWISLLGWPA